jgi:molybdopterin synthase catalytic subunit/molybdopterin synthase sulfur carrier subunit
MQETAPGTERGTVRVLAFAGARDVVGSGEVEIGLGDIGDGTSCTADQVMDAMVARYPDLESRRSIIRLAVNGSYVEGDAPVAAGDEVALIPPVAGG